jgi:hypothetical protein
LTAIPCLRTAAFVVYIDGKPYCGFADRWHAEEAVRLWQAYGFLTPKMRYAIDPNPWSQS